MLERHDFSQAILAQAISSRNPCCCSVQGELCVFVTFCVFCQPCIPMPRRGWSDAPAEWVQIVRGPRPKSVKCPTARGQSSAQPAGGNQTSGITMVRGRRASEDGVQRQEGERGRPPDEVHERGSPNWRPRLQPLEILIQCHVEGGIESRQISSSGASSGGPHQTHEHLHREGEEEGRCVPAGRDECPGSNGAGTRVRLQALMHEASNPMECQDVPSHGHRAIFASELAQFEGMCGPSCSWSGDDLRAKLQNSNDREGQGAETAGLWCRPLSIWFR